MSATAVSMQSISKRYGTAAEEIKAAALITQMRGGSYVPVWPKAKAVGEIVLPYKGW